MRGFLRFVREQGIIGLAIGFILGGAVQRVVSSLVTDVINPLIGVAFGGGVKSLDSAAFKIGKSKILYGHFLGTLLDFLIMAAVVYFFFKAIRLERLDLKKDGKKSK